MKLVLFDIDGTIMDWPQEHKDSFGVAAKKVFGLKDFKMVGGMGWTEQQIIMESLKAVGFEEEDIKAKMPEMMDAMVEYFEREIANSKVNVLPGAIDFLKALDKEGVLMGCVTGNLEKIARAKLKKAGINKYLKLGGFGSDHISRTELAKLAIKRAEENFGFVYGKNVYSIGDAPSDMKAGREAGAYKCIGVTKGIHTEEQLREAGADYVFPNLLDKEKLLKIILQ